MSERDPSIDSREEYFLQLLFYSGILFYCAYILGYLKNFDGLFDARGYILGGDFINYWTAAREVISHNVRGLFDLKGFHQYQQVLLQHPVEQMNIWGYPPIILPWITWLGYCPYLVSLTLLTVLTLALYLLALAAGRPNPWPVLSLILCAPSTLTNLADGQNGFLSAALIVGGLRLLDKRPVLAGILFGCMSYKPHLALLIPFALIAGGRWRAFFAAASTAIVLVAFSIGLYGVDPWLGFIHTTMPYQRSLLEIDAGTSALFLHKMATVFIAARMLGASISLAYGLNIVTALGSALTVMYVFKKPISSDLRNAVVLTATFLATPYAFSYDMPLLAAALLALMMVVKHRLSLFQQMLVFCVWVLPPVVFDFNTLHWPITPILIAGLLFVELHYCAVIKK